MLDEARIRRYARQIVLPEIGGGGQAKLLRSSVLVIGAGGLGSPLLLHLAAAGVGRIGIVDFDVVDETNLHRQVIYGEADVGRPKVEAAAERLRALRADLAVETFRLRIDAKTARELVPRFDIVADGSDNLETRLLVHEACLEAGRVLVSAAVQGMDGQLTVFRAHEGPPHPCLRCLHPDDPAEGVLPTCAQGGVLGPAAAVVGALQAVEVIKELVGGFPSLSGTLVLYDARSCEFTRLGVRRRPDCPLCGRFAAAAE